MKVTFREFLRSAGISFFSGIIAVVIASLNAGAMPTWPEIKIALIAASATLLGALLKYLSTDTVASAKNDIKAALQPGETIIVRKD
ncbi:MAG TPA: hypothetical protein PLV31_01455 [Gammaproteobacteria bacterium]|nr:hypothetical protein [Niabella sp.]HRA42340.1 hypothetical protein [Gammaproteobacteria bacterium]HQX21657.1 hypothetical protein [Niabella sp.]HRB37098.1 hypothetical protein [Niabella sp.]HRB44154.1 hypothetical protein [Niabella sp.]